jgi:beta-galactosidase
MKPGIPITLTAGLLFFCALPFNAGALPAPSAASHRPAATIDTLPHVRKPQPILTTLTSISPLTLRILNDSGLRDYANIVLDWELKANGLIRQKGSLGNLPILPNRPALIRLPVRIPSATTEELFLGLHYRYRNTKTAGGAAPRPTAITANSSAPGRTLASEELLLRPWAGSQIPVKPAGDLSFTDSNGLFTILSPIARLRFDKQTGWLQSYEVRDRRLVADSPGLKSRFWLEPADPGYIADSAAVSSSWKEAGHAPHLQLFSTSTGSQLVIVRAEYTLPETSCLLHLSYTINAAGEMQVGQSMEADSTKQGEPLPCFGMYWLLPAGFDSVAVYGGAVTPFRETNAWSARTYSGVRWCTITGPDGRGLRFTADSTLLSINTRSTDPRLIIDDPSQPYHLPYGNYRYTYKVSPVLPTEITKPGK